MISAKEARIITEENRKVLQKTIEDINYLIDEAAVNGKHSLTADGFISNETVNILRENGYVVHESDSHFQVLW